jgi:HK97 family phage major capsid protein
MHYVRSLKDSQNRPIYTEIGGTSPRTVYEYPVNVTENIANTDGASKALGVFGNFNGVLLGRRASAMVIEADPYSRFAYNETQFRMVSRWAFAYGDANSFVRILSAAA